MKIAWALLFGFLVAASSARADGDYVFILRDHSNPYWQTFARGIEDAAKAHGIQASVLMQQGETDAEEQINQVETALLRHPAMIAISPVNEQIGLLVMKKAQQAGVPIADLDSNVTPEEAAAANVAMAFTVGSDNWKIGEEAADTIAVLAGGKPGPVLILEGAPGSVPGKQRVDGFTARLKQAAPQLPVDSVSAMWERLQALNTTQDVLQRHPDLAFVYAANDAMALGAVEAIRSAGKTEQIRVVGVDGTAEARKAVLEGKLAATIAQLPYLVGQRAVELCVATVHGEKIAPRQTVPVLILTKEVLEKNQDPLLSYVR